MDLLAIDAGGTFTKLGNPLQNFFISHPNPITRDILIKEQISDTETLLLTGAGAEKIVKWFPDLKTYIIPEFIATGLGGTYLAGLKRAVVVNIGSGTPVLFADLIEKKVTHLGGTGMGSATIVGLAQAFLTGLSNLDEIGLEALKGDPSVVNLMIKDIYQDTSTLGLPPDITASNFGKYQNWEKKESQPKRNDLLAAIHVMVAETIATISNVASRSYKDVPIVITGGGTLNKALLKYLQSTYQYLQQDYIIPENAFYGTLHGTLVYKEVLTL